MVRDRERIAAATEILGPARRRARRSLDEHTRKLTVPAEGGASTLVAVVRDLGEAGIELDDVARPPTDPRRRVPVPDRARLGRGRRGGRGMTGRRCATA